MAAAADRPPLAEAVDDAPSLWTDPCAAVAVTPPRLGLGRMLGLLEAISGFEEDERRLPSEAALKIQMPIYPCSSHKNKCKISMKVAFTQ